MPKWVVPAQLLLAQPHRRFPLSSARWNPEPQLCNLSGREDSLSPWGIPPADFLFLANEETTLLVGVRKLLISHLSDCMCVGTQPTWLWKMAEMGCKNGRYPKSWNMSCSFSLWPIYSFKLSSWKIKLFVPLARCPLPSLRHGQNWGFVLHPACHCVQDLQKSPWRAAHQKEWRQKKAYPDEINVR